MNNIIQTIIGLPLIISIILKITIVLTAGWITHFIVAHYNPRWRVIIWRCVIVGILLVPALIPVRYLQIKIARSSENIISDSYSGPKSLNIAESSDFIVPPVELPVESSYVPEQVSYNNSYKSQKSFSLFTWICEKKITIAICVWAFTSVLLLVRLLIGFNRINRTVRSSSPAPEHLQQMLSKVSCDFNCHRKVILNISGKLHTPFLAGFFRPVIILPEQMISEKNMQETPAILAHEITHLCSGDIFWMFAARIAEILLWFHPLVWKLRNVHDAACEEVCDAVAAGYLGSAELYSSALARAALNVRGIVSTIGAIPMARSSNILIRLRTLKRKVYSSPIAKKWVALSVSAIMIVFICFGGLKLVYAEQNQSNNEEIPVSSSQNEYVYEGKLAFNKELPVDLSAGTSDYPELIKIKSVSFVEGKYTNAWTVSVNIGWMPVVDSSWKIKTELLDRDGKILHHSRDEETVFTCKASDSNNEAWQNVELDLDSMTNQGRRHAARFRLILEPVENPSVKEDAQMHTINVIAIEQEDKQSLADTALVVSSHYIQDIYTYRKTLYVTDSRGHCEIKFNRNDLSNLNIEARKQNFVTMAKSWTNSGSSSTNDSEIVNLPDTYKNEMLKASEIGGFVNDEDGNAIEAAKVIISVSLRMADGDISITRCVLTDSNGKWKIEGVPHETDRFQIGFRHPDYKSDPWASRLLSGQELIDVKALKYVGVLSKGITFTGKVLDDNGNAIQDAAVMISEGSSSPFFDITDSKGQFKLAASGNRGDYGSRAPTIIVEAQGYAPGKKEVDIVANPEPLKFKLSKGRDIKCHVVDKQGNPVAGGWTVFEPFDDNRDYSILLDNTDSKGDFIIPNVADRDIKLTVGKQGFITIRDYVIGASETEVTVVMKRSLTINGTVTDADTDRPIPNFGITAVYSQVYTNERPVLFTGGKYELSFNETSRQTMKLLVSAVGYEQAESEEFNIEEGTKEINFKLTRSAGVTKAPVVRMPQPSARTITGIVKDEKGLPVKDAVITSTEPFYDLDAVITEMATNAEGKFSFKIYMSSGGMGGVVSTAPMIQTTNIIIVRQKERNLAAVSEFDDKTDNLEITLSPGNIISGKVVDVNDSGIPQAELSLGYFISDRSIVSFPEPTKIDPNGNFEIRAVPQGLKYLISASGEGYGQREVQVNTSDIQEGSVNLKPLVLNAANLTVSGIVVDQFDELVSNARIYASGNGQPSMPDIYTNTKGEFIIENVCSGQINIQVQKESPEPLLGRVRANGGDQDIKIVISSVGTQSRIVPRQPASLVNKAFPNFENIEIDFSPEQSKGKRILICFWDIEQRPSRNLVTELSKKADELKEKNVVVLLIHSSEIKEDELHNWLDEYKVPFISGRITSDFDKVKFNWGVRGLPWLILTDKNGKIQAEGIDLEEGMKVINSSYYDEKTAGQVLQTTSEPSVRIITGIVKDVNGLPVKDAIITTMPFPGEEIITDNEGKFQFRRAVSSGGRTMTSPMFPETIYINARQKDRNLAAAVEYDDKTDNYEIKLSPGIIISSKVVDVNGTGIQNADITLVIWGSESGFGTRESAKINSDGSFEIRALSDGFRYSVQANADGFGERSITINTSEAVNERIDLEPLVLEVANLSVSGIVVDQFDQPISNARIVGHGNGQPSMRETYTNTKGEFTLDGLCAGGINLQVQKEGPEPLIGLKAAKGGDKDVKMVVSILNPQGRLVPRQPSSLVNRSFPNFESIEIEFSPEQSKGKRLLICFWDIEQRPSRNLVTELAKRADELTQKGVIVLLIHSSEVTVDELKKWLDEYKIPFISGRVVKDFERTLFKWNVRAQPWLILTDGNAKILSEGFNFSELSDRLDNKNTSEAGQIQKGAISDTIVLRLLDSEGMPVIGARVGTNVETRDNKVLNSNLSWSLREHENSISDQWGEVKLSREKLFPESWSEERKVGIYVLHEERKIGAICEVKSKEDERNVIELKLVPVCHVYGKLDSKGLNEVGQPLYWTNVYMGWDKDSFGVMSHSSEEQKFEFLVPPGKYELDAYGSGRQKDALQGITASTKSKIFSIEVKAGKSELDLGTVDIEPEKISAMVGKRAPEIGPIKEWKNGSPVKLADLIGKAVILYFDGDSPNTSRDFPPLVALYDQFHDKGLEIISLYNCESMEQLEKNWTEVLERFGGESEVPFLIAIDGGESGFYEGTDKVRLGQTYNTYDITGIPTTILIDTKGNIAGDLSLFSAKEIIPQMLGISIESEQSEWRRNFNKVYFLEDGKVLKRIAPPFIPERKEYYKVEDSTQYSFINEPPDFFTFHWDGKLNMWGGGFGSGKRPLKSVLNNNLSMNKNSFEGPDELLNVDVPGDWIVRKDATVEQKLKALEEILANELGRNIRFEKRFIERETIVATGSFKYKRFPLAQNDRYILMFSGDFMSEDDGGGGGTAKSVHEFIEAIGNCINMPLIDETKPPNDVTIPYRHYLSAFLSRINDRNEKAEKVLQLLDNITLQTNLHFNVETRPIEKWFVVESE
ncbi:MAG: carboxypeptidase regulatory-like domain-containing protein [Sedimentisphaerales bacterium]|nr:carboxypeptidase regulatory-like domain-containing protein [Sedimentisphaerales bacterium]